MKLKIIILITLLATALRSFDFGTNPPGLYVDEASQGYNSYSLMLTGRDEYGKSWPIFLRSFNTYPSALYSYLTILPIKILGLNIVSIRLISLLSGITLVWLVARYLGLVEGLVVAIAPVLIFFSRAAFEANLALTLFFFAIFLAVRAQHQPKLLAPSFIFFSISTYAYQAERFLSLLLMGYFFYSYWRTLSNRKYLIWATTLALIIQLPILSVSFTSGANARLLGLGNGGSIIEKISSFVRLYLIFFSPHNLFSKADPDLQRSFPELATFYWWMIAPLAVGIWQLIKKRSQLNLTEKTMLFIIFTSPIPGAMTKDYFSTLRVLPLFVGLSWVIALGLKKMINQHLFFYLIIIIISILELYPNLVLLKRERSTVWGYQYQQLANFISTIKDTPVVIDNSRQKPIYILLAFYHQYDPAKVQTSHHLSPASYYQQTAFDNDYTIDNIQIRPIVWEKDLLQKQILVADPLAISPKQAAEHHLTNIKQIIDLNGQVALNIFQTNQLR